MNEMEVLDLGRDAVWVFLKVSGPILIVGLAVGLSISIFQTLTSIQEIPPEHYKAVAEVIGYVMQLKVELAQAS